MQEIKTIIQLRNDTADNWATNEGQSTPLMPGEVAVEIVDGKAKLKIGTSEESTFGNSEYFASSAAIYNNTSEPVEYGSETTDQQVINQLTTGKTLNDGDCAIIKREIAEDKDYYSYTSYVYSNGQWAAMDGNYSAENVFTSDDIVLAGTYSTIGNLVKGDTVNAGTSLQALLTGMLSQRIQPGDPTLPTATISADSSDGNSEVGNTYTKPTGKITVTSGSYTNEGTNTGVKYLANNVTVAYGSNANTATYKKSNSGELGNGGSVSITATDYASGNTSATFTDDTVSYTFSGKAHNEAGNVAKDNLGANSDPEKKIAAGDITVTNKTVSYRGFRKMFAGNTTATSFDSTAIRALSLVKDGNSKNGAKASTATTTVTVPEGATNLVIACPTKSVGKKYTLSKVEMLSNGVWDDYTSKFEQINSADNTISVDGAVSGQNAQNYNVYIYKFAALKGNSQFRFTLKAVNA